MTQAPENGQNYNRYTYAYNNPLKYTDPSGFRADDRKIVCEECISAPGYTGLPMGHTHVTGSRIDDFFTTPVSPILYYIGANSITTMNNVMNDNFVDSRVETAIASGAVVAVNQDGD